MAGIYFHIPFCKQACTYCDFHFSVNLAKKENLLEAMLMELYTRKNYLANQTIQTIYFGGGTPSLLAAEELNQLLEAVKKLFQVSDDAEITLECNPDDLLEQKLQELKNIGVNRLSIGLQSFSNDELKWMNRAHTAEESIKSVILAKQTGFHNITIDLMYGSRFQNMQEWQKTLQTITDLNVQHISAYNLTIENKTPLGIKHKRGEEPSVNEDLSALQFNIMQKFLSENGFVHYEISNFGKPDFFSKHNTNYWFGVPYLGIGPSAHSFNGKQRQWNCSSNSAYIQAIEKGDVFFELEDLSNKDHYNEYVLTRLRTIWGCNTKEIETRFGRDYSLLFLKRAAAFGKYFINNNESFVLNNDGKLMADYLASELFAG